MPDCITLLSKGGLITPSELFLQQVRLLEQSFVQFNGLDDIHTFTGIVANLTTIMRNLSTIDVPYKVIVSFARIRTFTRMPFVPQIAVIDSAITTTTMFNDTFFSSC